MPARTTWRASSGLLVLASCLASALGWPRAPWLTLLSLLASFDPLTFAWRRASGTALRPAVAWGFVATGLAMLAQLVAAFEPLTAGRPWSGHLAYLTTLAALATLITVLNARTPGGGAWALLMGMLVLVFLVPWLEGSGLARAGRALDRLRLDAPWTLFYALVVLAGVTNYLPTRFGLAATVLGVGFLLEYLALTRPAWPASLRGSLWSSVPCSLSASLWLAARAGSHPPTGRVGLERSWLWFRDHWGVVWALRIEERFNRAAEASSWPFRLHWFGLTGLDPASPPPEVLPDGSLATFLGLVRRFAPSARVLAESEGHPPGPPTV